VTSNDTFDREPCVEPAESLALERRKRRRRRLWRLVLDILHDIAMVVIAVFLLVYFVGQAVRVKGPSMQPLLDDGERIVVDKISYRLREIRRGDIVVFWFPRDPNVSFIKRVTALPGDTLEIRRGVLYLNGERTREDFVRSTFRDNETLGPIVVQAGHYFVLGDHRNGSNDSRNWGEVPKKYIYGRAFFRFWPLSRMGFIQ
jgi:signal peptidase I